MAWRDRLRRRAAAPSAADPDRGVPGTPDAAVPDAPAPSVPGDWDGGWRRTAAPELTVSRAPLGVSDGLAFRAGLAAWQNPSFDSGLGHALLPMAPTGLVRGVARPATPQATHTAGGPLLLRALRADASGDEGSDAGALDGSTAARSPRVARRTGSGERNSGSAASGSGEDAPRSRGLTSTDSPAVLSSSPAAVQRAVEPGTGPVVAPADSGGRGAVPTTPLVRRVAVVPPAAADGAANRPATAPNSARASATSPGPVGRTSAGPAVQRTANETTRPQSQTSRTSAADGPQPAVRISPLRPLLTVARRPAAPVRRVAAVRPAGAPEPGPTSTTTAPPGTSPGATAPVQRAATPSRSRAPLGAPLSELPSTATPLAQSTPTPGTVPPPGQALPVVQRQADTPEPYDSGTSGPKGTAPDAPRPTPAPNTSGARARGGLGAPLSAMPPSAELPGSAASRASSRTTPGPDVQRAPARRDQRPATAPTPPTDPSPTAPVADAPLLGTVDVQRSLADHSTTEDATKAAPAAHPNGPATPLVAPPAAAAVDRPAPAGAVAAQGAPGNTRRPGSAPGGPGAGGASAGGSRVGGSTSGGSRADGSTSGGSHAHAPGSGRKGPQHPATPAPLVIARAVAPGGSGSIAGTQPSGSAGPRPLTVTGPAARSATAAPRTLSLLAARPLTLSTRTPEGAPPPAAARTGSRPVVAARWPGTPAAAPGGPAPTSGTSAPTNGTSAQTTASTAGAPAHSAPRASAPATATPHVQRAATAHPGTQGTQTMATGVPATASPAPVQRVPVVRPAPPRPVTAGVGAAVPAKPLPVTAPQAPPLADRPAAAASAPVGPVPVVRPRSVPPTGTATPVQRDATDSAGADLLKGVQVKEVPARGRSHSSSGASGSSAASASGRAAARRPETPRDDPGPDLDELARRLLDPVSRLLRTELRRGRERTGRPYDGRR
ncbi:hypothetical protein [Streptomyces sp. NPDC047043]|uniref:hypothetical protein n=1 Tax=Streptomyces sp. NPDC047043 TaxID=3154497 RepID=UPI00340D03DF